MANEMPGYDLRDFVYSPITIADTTGYISYGTPVPLPGARKLSRAAEPKEGEFWGDGSMMANLLKRGPAEIDLEVVGLDLAKEAELLGETQDATTKYVEESEDDTPKLIALGYTEYLADGRKKVYWEYWGSCRPVGEEYETYQGEIAFRARQLKFKGMLRPCDKKIRLKMDEDALPELATLDTFFSATTLMDTLPAAVVAPAG